MEILNLVDTDGYLEKYLWGLNQVLHMNCKQRVLLEAFMQGFPDYVVDSFYSDALPKIISGEEKESKGVVGLDEYGDRYCILFDNDNKLWYQVRSGENVKALCLYPNNKRTGRLFYFDDGKQLLLFTGSARGNDVHINCESFEKEKNK